MKHFSKLFICLGLMAVGAAGAPATYAAQPDKVKAMARDKEGEFQSGGLLFEIISQADATLRLGYMGGARSYKGDIVVPATVTYQGTEYTVVEIGPFCFDEDANALSSVTLPNTIRQLDKYSFYGTVIDKLTLPEGVEIIEDETFMEAQLEEINIPGTVTFIGEYAFCDCKSLKTVDMAEGVTMISDHMFDGCPKLEEFSLPSTMKSIGVMAFFECDVLPTLTLPEGLESIDRYAFSRCNAFTEVVIPSTCLTLGKGIFCSADNLHAVTFPEALTELPAETFSYCTGLTTYTVPDHIESIGTLCFEYCLNLQSVTFGSGVKTLADKTVTTCLALTQVGCKAPEPPTCVATTFPTEVYSQATLTVPMDKIDAYRQAEGWKNFGNIIGNPDWQSGISDVVAPTSGEERWYNLQGQEVVNPREGELLIRVNGEGARKVVY